MKVKLIVKEENITKYSELLKNAGFIISDDASLTLLEEDAKVKYIMGKSNGVVSIINVDDIVYFESFDHEIFMYTTDNKYRVREKLFELEQTLNPNKFLRINYSMIANIDAIKNISPLLGMKFRLTMSNKDRIEVTRNYYYRFKDFIGI